MSQAEARWLAIAAKSATDHLELGSRAAAARRCRSVWAVRTRLAWVAGVAAAVGAAAAPCNVAKCGEEAARWAADHGGLLVGHGAHDGRTQPWFDNLL